VAEYHRFSSTIRAYDWRIGYGGGYRVNPRAPSPLILDQYLTPFGSLLVAPHVVPRPAEKPRRIGFLNRVSEVRILPGAPPKSPQIAERRRSLGDYPGLPDTTLTPPGRGEVLCCPGSRKGNCKSSRRVSRKGLANAENLLVKLFLRYTLIGEQRTQR